MKKILLLCALCASLTPLWGGVFPKPEMDFSFAYQTEEQPAIRPATSEQVQCRDNQCINADPLGSYGIQKLYCRKDGCFSIAYEYAPYQKLAIDFSDGVKRESNVFATPFKLRNSFSVTVRANDLLVEPSAKPQAYNALLRADAWLSLMIVLVMETLAAFAYLAYNEKSYRVIYSVIIANLITMPLSWQVLVHWVPAPAFIWVFCLLFEALFIWSLNRRSLSQRNAFALSTAKKVTSYYIGILLSFLIAPLLF